MERQYRGRWSTQKVEQGKGGYRLENGWEYFAGIDWGSEQHAVCLIGTDGVVHKQRQFEHSGESLGEMVNWLRQGERPASVVAVAIEVPRGAIVESLLEQGFAVFSINPRQMDRFRDRYSPAGAKDDRRDAFVLADALRTDQHCFRRVRLDPPAMIRLRELSRLEDEMGQELFRTANRLREQWRRYFPQLLELSPAADQPWVWSLLEEAPTPAQAAKLSRARIARLLRRHHIRRFDADQVQAVLAAKPLTLAPGAVESVAEHALLLLPRLRLFNQQRADIARRVDAVLGNLAASEEPSGQHRDAAILLSLPGLGRKVAATMLSEAAEAIADRDYHALRCYSGTAPVTHQSGKKKLVLMRRGCNQRLRMALFYWSRASLACDHRSWLAYEQMRARGHSHGRALRGMADRWLEVLVSMLRHHTLYDAQKHAA